MKDLDDIQKVIRLKRYEKPKDGYFEEFISEFQRRQRSEMLQRSAHGIFCERVATYVSSFGKQPWFIGAGAGAAAAVVVMFTYGGGANNVAKDEVPSYTIDESVLWNVNTMIPASPDETPAPVFIDWGNLQGELMPVPRDF